MDTQELQDPEKVSTIWVRNFAKVVNKINSTISLMIGMKPKDTIKLHAVPLDKTYPDQPGEQHEDQKWQQTLSGVKVHIDSIELCMNQIIASGTNLQDEPDRAFVHEELMHISEDTQAPPEWVSKWK